MKKEHPVLKFCNSHPVWFCLIASSLAAIASVVPVVIANGGTPALTHDFVDQQISFAAMLHNAITSTPLGEWTWNLDLGSSIINGLAFYNLASPFTWIGQLFDTVHFPYAIAWILALKYVCASLAGYWYLSLFVKKPIWAVTGGILYAFSGFQAGNTMFYHFHDTVVFFPLMLVGLEKILREGNFLWFSAFVCLNAVTNYYFFLEECILVILYFLFRNLGLSWKVIWHNFLFSLAGGLLGVGMASCILLPSALYLLGNPRSVTEHGWPYYLWGGEQHLMYILYILRGLFFPAEAFYQASLPVTRLYWSGFAYIPVISFSCAACYIWKYKLNWLSGFLVLLILISFSSRVSSWFLFGIDLNQRWWFCLVLMAVLASTLALEQVEFARNIQIWTVVWTLLTILLFVWIVTTKDPGVKVYNAPRLFWLMVVASVGLALFWAWCRFNRNPVVLLLLILVYGAGQQAYSLELYSRGRETDYAYSQIEVGRQLPSYDDRYRYATDNNMFGMSGEASGVGSFSSTIENGSRWYAYMLGNRWEIYTEMPWLVGRDQLLGGKYVIEEVPHGTEDSDALATYESRGYTFTVKEQPAAPMVRYAAGYVLQTDLDTVPGVNKAFPLFQYASFLNDEAVAGKYPKLDVNTFDLSLDPDEYARMAEENSVANFSRDNTGFSFKTDRTEPSLITTSIPYSKGWKATIDGVTATVLDGSGMIAMEVPAGNHTVKFVYHTPGFRLGLCLSAIAFAIFGLLCWKGNFLWKQNGTI